MNTFVYSTLGGRNARTSPRSALLATAQECAAREDWGSAYQVLQQAAEDPSDKRSAHFMLWEVCQVLGDPGLAIINLRAALQDNPVTSRYCATPRRRVLVLAVPGDFQANAPLDALFGASSTELHTLWLTDPEAVLREPLSALDKGVPPFDCVFIAIAEDARHYLALQAADRLADALNVPVINRGRRISAVSRTGAAELLQGLADAVVPCQMLIGRTSLLTDSRVEFPAIIRPAGSHAGKDLARIDSPEALRTYVAGTTGESFYAAPFVNYQSNDGMWRKYRIIFVDGRPWPYHMAIHSDWAIWYYNARMDLDAWKRLEEARFVKNIEDVFPDRAMRALEAVAACLGLDYFGIDCGLMQDGRVVIFEIETGMIVHDWDCPEIYPYKKMCAHAIRQATEKMIDSRIRGF